MKWCPDCRRNKPLEEFPRNRSTKTGRATYCKPCHTKRIRRNKDRRYGGEKQFLLRLRYGVTQEDVDRLLAAQGGVCAVCLTTPGQHVDHDHDTGKVRGIRCFTCNNALGKFGDNRARLHRAIGYLQRHDLSA